MDDSISRQAALCSYQKEVCNKVKCYECKATDEDGTCKLERWIKKLPSAERHGSWGHLGGDEWFCSACGHVITTEGSWERPWQKYCEECGAKMIREDEEMSKVSEMEMAYGEYLNG